MRDRRPRRRPTRVPQVTLWDRVQKFQGMLAVLAGILGTSVYFYGFVKLDLDKFRNTDITVASQVGLLFIEWDLGDTPEVPTHIIYYINGVQFANEEYPEGLKEAVGVRTKYIASYVLPPIVHLNPGDQEFKAVAVFNGWSTLFTPKTVTFSTEFSTGGEDETLNEGSFNFKRHAPSQYIV